MLRPRAKELFFQRGGKAVLFPCKRAFADNTGVEKNLFVWGSKWNGYHETNIIADINTIDLDIVRNVLDSHGDNAKKWSSTTKR